MADGVRLQKVIADAGIASRRAAEALIAAGRVSVNGRTATLGQRVDPDHDALTVDGLPVQATPAPVYLAVAKPAGVTSTVSDRHAERPVVELVPAELRRRAVRLYPVGRLDRDSEGLLLLTNDGQWAQRLLHPRHEVEREYAVGVARPLTHEQQAGLALGVEMEEGIARLEGLRRLSAAEVGELGRSAGGPVGELTWYRAVLRQGWKRQLRRMFFAVGASVERLVRVRFGTLALAGMRAGDVRELSAPEAAALVGGRGGGRLVVALDGPGGSGKSSVGAGAALRLGYRFCDTGVLYRGLTWLALERGVDPDDAAGLMALVRHIELAPDDNRRYVRLLADGRDVTAELHTAAVDRDVSRVSRHAPVRASLLPIQRALAAEGGIIMAGRDIGTVVLPDADLKIYLDVSLEERARRRARERGIGEDDPQMETIRAELRRRDGIDTTRETAPLRQPDDAVVVRSEGNTLEQTVTMVAGVIEQAMRHD